MSHLPSLCNDVAVVLPPVSPIISQYKITEGQHLTLTCTADFTGSKVNLTNSTIEWFYNSMPLNATSACTDPEEETVCSLSVTLYVGGNNSIGIYSCILTVPCCNETIISKCHSKKVVTLYKSKVETIVKFYVTPNYVIYIIYLAALCITLGFLVTIKSACLKVTNANVKCWQFCCATQQKTESNIMNNSQSDDSSLGNSESNCEEFHYEGHYNRNTTTKTDKNVQFGVMLSTRSPISS